MLVVFSRVLLDSRPRFVGLSIHPSIHPLVCQSHFTVSAFMGFLGMPLLPKYCFVHPSVCLLVCVHKWKKQAFLLLPTRLPLVLAVYLALFYLFWSKQIIFFTIRMGASKTIFFCLYQTHFIPSLCSVYETPKMAFLKCQKWCFWNAKNGVSETPKMAFLKRQKWRKWNAKNGVNETPKMVILKRQKCRFWNAKKGVSETLNAVVA